jgi:DNA-binding MarR family transcriptional regulator
MRDLNIALPNLHDEEAPLGVLEHLAGYHLRRVSSAFGADFARAVEGTGMRQVLFGILSVVGANPGINQGAAGRSLGIQRANMVTLINQLADVGLLDRQTAADDRRALALSLTTAGEKMLEECLERIEAHEEDMLAGLTAAERKTLIGLLTKIEGRKR